MIHVFYGADDFSAHEALYEVKLAMGDPSMLDSNTSRLEGAKLRPEELEAAVQSMPFFGGKRLVIAEGLLGRFEPKEKRGAAKKPVKPLKEGEIALHVVFAKLINAVPDTTELVMLDVEIKKTNPLLKELSPKADIRIFEPLKGIQLESWVRKRAGKVGASLSDASIKELVKLVGGDLWVMHGELQKLALYAAGRSIEPEDVKKLVGLSREASIFALVDAVIEGRLKEANESMYELLESGSAPSYVLSMLGRQLRNMVRAKDLKAAGQSDAAIQSALGLADFPFRKTLEQASKYSMAKLSDFYHRLLDADIAIKTGKYDDELALIILISELASQPR
jgi:DNA polymerase III subunit delta